MSTEFLEVYTRIDDALKASYEEIESIKDDRIGNLKNRILMSLTRLRNQIKSTGGLKDFGVTNVAKVTTKQLTKMFGYDVNQKPTKRLKKIATEREFKKESIQTTQDQEGTLLNKKANRLYDDFLKIENDKIIDEHSKDEIRGVAKLAGLPITQQTEVNTKFVDHIKDAIKKQIEIEKKDAILIKETAPKNGDTTIKKEESSTKK